MDININISVVFGWALLDRCVIVDDVLGNHGSDSLIATVAEVRPWMHQPCAFSPILFQNHKVCWYIKFQVATAAAIISFDLNKDTLVVLICRSSHFICGIS
jgi:hypothetical protein